MLSLARWPRHARRQSGFSVSTADRTSYVPTKLASSPPFVVVRQAMNNGVHIVDRPTRRFQYDDVCAMASTARTFPTPRTARAALRRAARRGHLILAARDTRRAGAAPHLAAEEEVSAAVGANHRQQCRRRFEPLADASKFASDDRQRRRNLTVVKQYLTGPRRPSAPEAATPLCVAEIVDAAAAALIRRRARSPLPPVTQQQQQQSQWVLVPLRRPSVIRLP